MNILFIVIGVLILWSVWGYFSSRVEQTDYSVTSRANGYEIRTYPAHLVAQTTIQGSYDDALREGFKIVAGYIFGGNVKKESVAMTAPVTSEKAPSEKIAMTAPVTAREEQGAHVISFGMPKNYTLETLPTPTDPRVTIVEVPTKKMAVLRFSWFANGARIQQMEQKLLSMLKRDNVEVLGNPQYAGYNAPWTPPWMTRNEVLVEIR